ncbi:MAG TPA: ATP-binding protein [Thermoanaerobaculia bacterium]|jgi:signal transduction histidine kinase|nr:ATP-binding protein [Thermoanaerobaculia bacterium]
MKVPASLTSRRLLLATVAFGIFLLLDIALFGWLMFRSLSEREIQRALGETRTEAESLARQIAKNAETHKNLFTAVAVERETQTYIDSILARRDIVRTVEIRDKSGVLVLRDQRHTEVFDPQGPLIGSPELPRGAPRQRVTQRRFETPVAAPLAPATADAPNVRVPIGSLGVIEIGISQSELAKRTSSLRAELIRQTGLISVLTIALIGSAYAIILTLLRRARRLEIQAAEAERLAYIGTLASGLAHEIRNPLNSLNLNMQMLEEEIEDRAPAGSGRRLLAITRSEIGRLERLVTDFLSYAKPRALERAEMPAVALCEKVSEILAGEIQRRGAQLLVEDRSAGARITVDASQMTQLLLNLVQNALNATEEVARPVLKLAVRLVERPAGRSDRSDGRQVAIEVSDNGIGIPADELPKIFDLFYSTRKGGTGLGLAIVERIAKAHGGSVRIESRPEQGTTVAVLLPLALPATAPATDAPSPRFAARADSGGRPAVTPRTSALRTPPG